MTAPKLTEAQRVIVVCWKCDREWSADDRSPDAKCPHCGASGSDEEHGVFECNCGDVYLSIHGRHGPYCPTDAGRAALRGES